MGNGMVETEQHKTVSSNFWSRRQSQQPYNTSTIQNNFNDPESFIPHLKLNMQTNLNSGPQGSTYTTLDHTHGTEGNFNNRTMMNFNHDHSFLELVSDGDQINLSSNALPHFESRNSEPRQAKTQNPKLRGKFHMNVYPN
jgi:hypothetical protein